MDLGFGHLRSVSIGTPLTPSPATDMTVGLSHLRDGFAKALETRTGSLGPEEAAAVNEQINALKRLFPRDNLNVGDELCFSVTGDSVALSLNVRRQEL